MGYEGVYPWQGSNLHSTVFETAASANWATGARGASGGQRSRNLRDVDAALCQLSYAGLVGSGGFEPPSPVYQTGALSHCATIRGWPGGNRTRNRVYIRHLRSHCATGHSKRGDKETRRSEPLSPCLLVFLSRCGGPERIRTSTAMRRFYRALGSLMPSRPVEWCCSRESNPDHLFGRQVRSPLRHSSMGWSRQ